MATIMWLFYSLTLRIVCVVDDIFILATCCRLHTIIRSISECRLDGGMSHIKIELKGKSCHSKFVLCALVYMIIRTTATATPVTIAIKAMALTLSQSKRTYAVL